MTDSESKWPVGAVLQGVRFAAPEVGSRPLAELPAPISRQAIAVPAKEEATFELLAIPVDQPDALDPADSIRAWVLAGGGSVARYQLIVVHGARIHWGLPRLALSTQPEFVEPVRRALLETAFLESELQAIETGLAEMWPDAEADGPRAFEFRERDMGQRERLAQRFMKVLLFRSRLAKITPPLLMPQPYPPTLPGQVAERLRERLGVHHRVESLQTQLELFERIYEGAGQRATEFVLARRSITLEWVIILLLTLQTLLVLFEFLNGTKG